VRRVLFITLPVLIPLATLLIVLVVAEAERPAEWEVQLSEYLTHRNAVQPGTVRLEQITQATKPWNYSPEMGHAVFGNDFNSETLPFPPEQIRCVLLENRQTQDEEVIFLAYHSDQLWNMDWVVHKPTVALSDPRLVEFMQMIGCSL
jgi:hypothetical protein